MHSTKSNYYKLPEIGASKIIVSENSLVRQEDKLHNTNIGRESINYEEEYLEEWLDNDETLHDQYLISSSTPVKVCILYFSPSYKKCQIFNLYYYKRLTEIVMCPVFRPQQT